ncbi:hypothetical protein VTI74DRAFT_11309 [Chaetomium olivicolor]
MASVPDMVASLLSRQGGDGSAHTAALKEVLRLAVQQDSSDGLAGVVEKLADAARDPCWRQPLGESGVLDHVLSVVSAESGTLLKKQALRLIGNACADCDDNRAKVVRARSLPNLIIDCLNRDDLLCFAIGAAHNLCIDFQPAQAQASAAGLSSRLVNIVSGERLSTCEPVLSQVMTVLELLCNEDSEPKIANPHTPTRLLELAVSARYEADMDTFMEICTPALAYLTFQTLQPTFLDSNGFSLLQTAFHQLYTRFDITELDADTTSQLKQVGGAFLTVFADISALPEFSTACPLDSEAVATLVDWLKLPSDLSHLQTAACLSLGNLSRSDESGMKLMNASGPLIDILASATPRGSSHPAAANNSTPLQLVHAALSFLKNLAIPQPNKARLGSLLLDPSGPMILPQIWSTTRTQPQLQFAAVSLSRLLLVNCPSNVRFICALLPNKTEHPTNLSLLHSIASSADEEPIKMEAARAVALVCRALHSSPFFDVLDKGWTSPAPATDDSSSTAEAPLLSFYTAHTPQIPSSLFFLLTQPRFPAVRSDAIFTLALMSRSAAGARMALRALQFRDTPTTITTTTTHEDNNSTAPSTTKTTGWSVLAEAITGLNSSDPLVQQFSDLTIGTDGRRGGRGGCDPTTPTTAITTTTTETKPELDTKGKEENGVTIQKLSPRTLQPQAPQQQQRQPARMAQMDRENGMVLIAELLHRFPDDLSALREPLRAVLEKGGELVSGDRERMQRE